ncbi:glycosyltransferase [Glycomyces dulcitolivorans]|uniref:glycosyltransferase n=1 Tax=Glycomyces dulcitolivorans TaxID=2200759 RepID=UPI000DD3F824|nr:glycosyltransferase [Glycomyces dulcitolivorans]
MIAQIATAAAALAFLVLAGLACRAAVRIRHLRKDTEARQATALLLHRLARRPTNGTADAQRLRRIEEALAGGFPDSAVEAARTVASTGSIPVAERLSLLRKVARWQDADEQAPARIGRVQFDIVVVSHFGLPGGTTSANEAEIKIWHEQGLTVGLLHHPVYDWGPNAPVHPRIRALVDAGAARLIGDEAEVECGLALVRLPIVMMRPLERRPAIRAGRTAVLVNQTPFKYYGETGPREAAWDVATVARNVEEWLGRPVWYAGGPCVLAALREHHAEETVGLDLADEPWNEVIAVDDWRLPGRREPDCRVRIGRHSRDHELKWPRDPEVLLACHPDRDPFEIHVLGGADIPARTLDGLPANWTVHEFNAVGVREFLAGIDVFAYFIADDGLEAFGRAPLEAMAAGVPVIMDPRFAPTFGPAALYCEPGEVAAVAERLAADPAAYAAQRSAAWDHLERHFSARALMERVSRCAPSAQPRQRTAPSSDRHRVPAGVDDRG